MAGTDIATAAHAFKTAARDAAATLYAATSDTHDVQVKFGRPASFLDADIVAFGRLASRQDVANLGTNRSRNEFVELDVIFSSFQHGGDEAEEVASARAYYLLRLLERQFRMTDTRVGNTVEWCFLQSHQSDGMTAKNVIKAGRNIFVTATFEAKIRITA